MCVREDPNRHISFAATGLPQGSDHQHKFPTGRHHLKPPIEPRLVERASVQNSTTFFRYHLEEGSFSFPCDSWDRSREMAFLNASSRPPPFPLDSETQWSTKKK